ncbi:hypothetical protein H257_08231 [Aphanomyces astaci]|uniref:Uncharacterized protein n=1 Tax=Aphanomyces astaci TaxID=112090 RepID=W4GG23_APHAT|nr:hypothetical protein H257_08231 [Aphanomyces astaci]ETV78014.1 hypothetical protein H257_08231 [Aphanomyces astaci]|eukprot:XP_009832351.1 hypothetical protein H257_08231 [Aphanomyces astaci]
MTLGPASPLLCRKPNALAFQARQSVRARVGFLFLVVSATSSASFFAVTKSKIGNNFLRERFNSIVMEAFLVNSYNVEVLFRPQSATGLNMVNVKFQEFYNGSVSTLSINSQYSSHVAQFEALSVLAMTAGFQSTSVRDLPCLATQYKAIGLVETVLVQNTLGISYPLTMKTSNGSYRFDLETSRKMYWGWGSDLWTLTHNATTMGGSSLIRSSSHFCFHNQSEIRLVSKQLASPTPGCRAVAGSSRVGAIWQHRHVSHAVS